MFAGGSGVLRKAIYGCKTDESASWLMNGNTVCVCGILVRFRDLVEPCPRKIKDRVIVIFDGFASAFFSYANYSIE